LRCPLRSWMMSRVFNVDDSTWGPSKGGLRGAAWWIAFADGEGPAARFAVCWVACTGSTADASCTALSASASAGCASGLDCASDPLLSLSFAGPAWISAFGWDTMEPSSFEGIDTLGIGLRGPLCNREESHASPWTGMLGRGFAGIDARGSGFVGSNEGTRIGAGLDRIEFSVAGVAEFPGIAFGEDAGASWD
jgi:hypothetical protein